MTLPDILDIRERVYAAIADHIGTFANGRPAIWVVPPVCPSELMPITGIYAELNAVPSGDSVPLMGTYIKLDHSYDLTLVNFSQTISLFPVKMAIEKNFSLRRSPVYLPPTDATLEQCRFSLWEPALLKR